MKGPIIPEAESALESGDITAVLKWVRPDDEQEVRDAFSQAVAVREEGPAAKELADRYFLETLIRVHRAGEGAAYTGLKDTPPEKIVMLADEALAKGSADEMIRLLQGHLEEAVRERFGKAAAAAKDKDKSIEAGREFVEAYVQYVHYVEGVHAAIAGAGGHHEETQAEHTD
jgi:hypothetical protein